MAGKSMQARLIQAALRRFIKPIFAVTADETTELLHARHRFDRLIHWLPAPRGVQVQPVQLPDLHGEWILPNHPGSRVILYLHGGAYILGSPASHRDLTAALATRCNARVFSLDYRLAPEAGFNEWQEDSVRAYQHLLHAGIEAKHILLAGDSAGGNLVLTTLLRLRDAGITLPSAAICLSPWTDLTGDNPSMTRNASRDAMLDAPGIRALGHYHARTSSTQNPYLSPVYGDLRGLPPLLLHVSDQEILFDDSIHLAEQAQACGVKVELRIWPGMPHVFQAFIRYLPEARQALEDIKRFADTHTPQPGL
ncbi:MAG: alpha/beta hydrolase [Pseudomonadales bacterium]|nr:alpha/beta hydrolase [Pseudomonadales bacterium]